MEKRMVRMKDVVWSNRRVERGLQAFYYLTASFKEFGWRDEKDCRLPVIELRVRFWGEGEERVMYYAVSGHNRRDAYLAAGCKGLIPVDVVEMTVEELERFVYKQE